MKHRFVPVLAAMILALAAGRALADDDQYTAPDLDGSAALAERLATFAHQTFHQRKIPQKALQIDAALYRAAMKLNPSEPRFARALADVLMQLNDVQGAKNALSTYMALVPSDQSAQVQFIDLCLASDSMQSLDQRLNYLRFLLKKQQIPNPVKSEIAFRASQLLTDRGEDKEAMKLLDSARVLNPVNLKVLRIRYILTQQNALPTDRVQQLLGIMQANPSDPVVASRLAEQLAQLGLVDPSIVWYSIANKLYNMTNLRADPAFVLGASSELLIGKKSEDSVGLALKYTNMLPEDADGWFVVISVLKFQLALYPEQQMRDLQTATERKAGIALSNRIMVLREMTGDTQATTRPVDSPTDTVLPDLSDDADRFKATQYRDLLPIYRGSLESLAWLRLYYQRDAKAAAPLIDDLERISRRNDPTVQRLRAWQQYVGGDPAGALPRLQALAANDPLAALGAILIELSDPAKQATAIPKAQKLLNEHPAGVVGAVLWSEFIRYHLEIEPSRDSGPAATLVANVPPNLMQIISEPRSVYRVQVAPLKASYRFGEPIFVRLSMQNIGSLDLAVGDDCVLHPELWFDAKLRGVLSQNVSGAAAGRLDQRLVLAPGDSVSTILRVDQDALYRFFANNPNIDLAVNLVAYTNPTSSQAGPQNQTVIGPGVCGFAQPCTQLIAREPTPFDSPAQRLAMYEGLNSDDGAEKIRTMGLVASYIQLLNANKGTAGIAPILAELLGKLHRVDNGGKDCVLSYQKYLLALVSTGQDQLDGINAMAADEHWQTRLLALQLANELGDKGIPVAEQLSGSSDPIIRDYAIALTQSLQAAATQPSNPTPAPETSQTPQTP